MTLIARDPEGPQRPPFRRRSGKALGEHPQRGGTITVKNGRYGAYVSVDGINATCPATRRRRTSPREAIALIERARRKGGGKPKRGAKKKAPAKKAAAKPIAPRRSRPRRAVAKKAAAKPKAGGAAASKARAPVKAKTNAGQEGRQNCREEERGQERITVSKKRDTGLSDPGCDYSNSCATHPGKVGTREIAREFG